jgi:hypothetical protein
MEGRLTNNIRWNGHVLRMNKDRIPKKDFEHKEKCPSGRPRSRWEQKVKNYVTHEEGRKNMGRN